MEMFLQITLFLVHFGVYANIIILDVLLVFLAYIKECRYICLNKCTYGNIATLKFLSPLFEFIKI